MADLLRRFVIGALVTLCLGAPALAQMITGSYRVEGRNPDGSAYSGRVVIADAQGAIAMTWTVGDQTYQGTGTRSQDVIWIDWGDQYPVVYVRMPSGELHGTWSNGRALERLIP